ncbi:hypothetical protein LMH73_015230 [Vibrio splendidus]|nr:hypothetical protein [Vibrio splendidus]MCC4882871.1 hypothetical protein [Vibrio splendidus]
MNDFFFKVDIALETRVIAGSNYLNQYTANLVRNSDLEVVGKVNFLRLDVESILSETGTCQLVGAAASEYSEFTCAFDWLMANSADDYSRFFSVKTRFHNSVENYCLEHKHAHRGNIIYIEELKLSPRHIGKGLGRYLLKAISNYFGSDDGVVTLQSCPLQLCCHLSISKEYRYLGKSPESDRKKLLQWYKVNGFKQIEENSHDWLFATTEDLNKLDVNPLTTFTLDRARSQKEVI